VTKNNRKPAAHQPHQHPRKTENTENTEMITTGTEEKRHG